jgi:hypothetical protein
VEKSGPKSVLLPSFFKLEAPIKHSPKRRIFAKSGHPAASLFFLGKKDIRRSAQGCQMVYFQTKYPNLDEIWRALELKILLYFMPIWNIRHLFGIFYGHLVILW